MRAEVNILLSRHSDDLKFLSAELVFALGGDVGSLPIAKAGQRWVNYNELCEWLRPRSEIVLVYMDSMGYFAYDDFHQDRNLNMLALSDDGLAIATDRPGIFENASSPLGDTLWTKVNEAFQQTWAIELPDHNFFPDDLIHLEQDRDRLFEANAIKICRT